MSEAIQATQNTSFTGALKPTLYFIGMTTGQSSIMRVFPRWAQHLKLGDVAIQGIDCQWHDDPAVYQRVVTFIKGDPLSLGALVTTHKIDLLRVRTRSSPGISAAFPSELANSAATPWTRSPAAWR